MQPTSQPSKLPPTTVQAQRHPAPQQYGAVRDHEPIINSTHFTLDSYCQKHSQSCAAACLFLIVRNFSLQKNPTLLTELSSNSEKAMLCPYYDQDFFLQFCNEDDIYRMTSGFQGDIFQVSSGQVSFPHNVVLAAKNFGLETKVYIAPSVCTEIMQQDPDLEEEMQLLAVATNINYHVAPELKEGEFEMKLCLWVDPSKETQGFSSWNDVSHWIVSRPDHSIMEPGAGANFKSLDAFNAQSKLHLIETGVSIVLKESGDKRR